MKLTCADLFCGAGGFSEGFRQAGFRVTKVLDLWAPAVVTHEKNHPDTEAIRGDILTYKPQDLGALDVLIGSPPCTEFSFANRGGNGDIEAGLRLVYRFLRFVAELEPKYWVMENVPRTLDYLPPEVPYRKLGIDKKGSLEIPVRTVFVSADFGVPQKRARAFSGNFPMPKRTHAESPALGLPRWRTLGDVVTALGDPLRRPALGSDVADPVYGFRLPVHELTDHYSDELELSDEEVRENRKAKEDHSWYGRMAFPDELDRPARTVMATQLRVSRETTVISASTGGYRRLSVREASSAQAFPITYQWWGKSESLKYKLIGNAVAPPVAFAIASAIVKAEQRKVPDRPLVYEIVHHPVPELAAVRRKPKSLPLRRKFREHVPGSRVAGYRVDFDNLGTAPAKDPGWLVGRSRATHLSEWRTVLYRGSGKGVRSDAVGILDAAKKLALTVMDEGDLLRAQKFLDELHAEFASTVPDASTLQAIRAEKVSGRVTPLLIIDRIANVVRHHYESAPTVVSLQRRSADVVPRRTAAYLLATAYVCELINRGTLWLSEHRQESYPPDPFARPAERLASLDFTDRLDRKISKTIKRHRPRTRRDRAARAEVEQLTIHSA